jgi:hypothetical protein
MTRYWVIAPYSIDSPEIWDKVWQYDLVADVISLGWSELGDISNYDENGLRTAIEHTYGNNSPASNAIVYSMLWNFYHNIQVGDIVVARKGRKKIAAIGTVKITAYFDQAKNAEAVGQENSHSSYIGVHWHDTPRDLEFDHIVFGMQALHEISESKFKKFTVADSETKLEPFAQEGVENQTEFILEKYLEEFIASNFKHIFKGQLVLYKDPQENVIGQQYGTDVGDIDILAQEPSTNSFVVIELKKGRETDKVVGQTLRYIGWVSEHLCENGQSVKGMIICRDPDIRLSYALKSVSNITVKYYRVDFKLSDTPFKAS